MKRRPIIVILFVYVGAMFNQECIGQNRTRLTHLLEMNRVIKNAPPPKKKYVWGINRVMENAMKITCWGMNRVLKIHVL
jgi:hypothetical protein